MFHKPNYTRYRQPIHGFTLVELLVVISIIALLLSILMPSLQKVREQAKGVVCLSNLRQLYFGVSMYSQENDGWLPIAAADPSNNRVDKPAWYTEIAPYLDYANQVYPRLVADGAWHNRLVDNTDVQAPKILVCPGGKKNWLGYGWNWRYAGYSPSVPGNDQREKISKSKGKIRRPSQAVLGDNCQLTQDEYKSKDYFKKAASTRTSNGRLFVQLWLNNGNEHVPMPAEYKQNWWGDQFRPYYISGRHNSGSNILRLNGVAEYVRYIDLVNPETAGRKIFEP